MQFVELFVGTVVTEYVNNIGYFWCTKMILSHIRPFVYHTIKAHRVNETANIGPPKAVLTLYIQMTRITYNDPQVTMIGPP
ncbi:uncharacterized protein LOC143182865 isoform X3 [Calliopsis andreniformis]|uniref:uncharacterized protein LOC143182865 isoform X3 n=1 Tax=Calliopsis andreniformis TaxID=337506 RepID=UPI003FCE8F0B